MTMSKSNEIEPFGGYFQATATADPDPELTSVGPGTPCGEYLRRFWHPVALSKQLTDVPLRVRIMGEELVAFRDGSGQVGLLHKHCCHRRASLEYGRVEERGIRCCYHGWLFDTDGRILDLPAEPDDSPIFRIVAQGAYPALEYKGLVFAYLGPPGEQPEFPIFDTHDLPGEEVVPYCVHNPCNWLQVFEQGSDPVHAVILHSRMSGTHFSESWGLLPELEYFETPDRTGMSSLIMRYWGEFVWIRHLESVFPNSYRVPDLFQDAGRETWFSRASITTWIVPVDDTECILFGWRHYNGELDIAGKGDPTLCGVNSVDFVGQTGNRNYEEAQRTPSDYEVLHSQGPIAIHDFEHLAQSDGGVALVRKALRQAVRDLQAGKAPPRRQANADGVLPSISGDVIFPLVDNADRATESLTKIGHIVSQAVTGTMDLPHAARRIEIERRVREAVATA